MKDLYDIYEDGAVTATPGNTVGMGNPTPPTDGEVGSEPMCGKGKCKKEKRKKKVEESLLDKTSDKVKNFSLKSMVAQWFAENQKINNRRKIEEVIAIYETQIIDNGDGTFDIDTSLNTHKGWSLDLFNIPKEGIPEWLKIRNVKADFSRVDITSWSGDLHNLNWRFLNGRTVDADVDIRFWTKDNIVLGPIRCGKLNVYSSQSKHLDIHGATVNECELKYCQNLKYVTGIPNGCVSVSLPDLVIEEYLKDNGLIPLSAKLKR